MARARKTIETARYRDPIPSTVQSWLFESTENPPLREASDLYQHAHARSHRPIAGDSLPAMNALPKKGSVARTIQGLEIPPS